MEKFDDTPEGFTIPQSFLNQLEEYTVGFILLVCNDKGEIYAHESYDNPVIKLGLTNFADMHARAAQKHMHNIALKEEEENYDDED